MKNKDYVKWIFVLPALIIVTFLIFYPIMSSIFYSFTNKNLIKPAYRFVGFGNYKAVLTNEVFLKSFVNSIKWTVFSLLGQILVGFITALALDRIKHGKKIYRTLTGNCSNSDLYLY